ncbi:MAG TPA: DEAD/DEAH box helicase [Marinagarivorans sp.]
MTFSTLALTPPLLKAIDECGYTEPTAVQARTIPFALNGRDILATAQTGTGKTASFVLPLLHQLSQGPDADAGKRSPDVGDEYRRRPKRFRALILVPTRELALQVESSIHNYARHLAIKVMSMVGGEPYDRQKQQLIDGVDILVATPGRFLDLRQQRALHCDEVRALVLDEADRMLDMGFGNDIRKILALLPAQRQNLFFSATLPKAVRTLAQAVVNNPVEIDITAAPSPTPLIEQWLIATDKHNKSALLSQLIQQHTWSQALIFIRTQHGAAKLINQLAKRGITAETIHGGRSQASRKQIMSDFKTGKIAYLVATGIAARGIDIHGLTRVVNYDLPDDTDDYLHRIGRTGRAGVKGEAVSLVSKDDFKRLCAIERRMNTIIERRTLEGFTVTKDLPPSNLDFVRQSKDKSPYAANAANKQNALATPPPMTNAAVWAPWQQKSKPYE